MKRRRKSHWHVDLRGVPLKFSVWGHSAPSEKSKSGALLLRVLRTEGWFSRVLRSPMFQSLFQSFQLLGRRHPGEQNGKGATQILPIDLCIHDGQESIVSAG